MSQLAQYASFCNLHSILGYAILQRLQEPKANPWTDTDEQNTEPQGLKMTGLQRRKKPSKHGV
jgi:hypothetical protein